MHVNGILEELRREHQIIEETIVLLERLVQARGPRRGRPPGSLNIKTREQSGTKAKPREKNAQASQRAEE